MDEEEARRWTAWIDEIARMRMLLPGPTFEISRGERGYEAVRPGTDDRYVWNGDAWVRPPE